jgi:hypothetical protein
MRITLFNALVNHHPVVDHPMTMGVSMGLSTVVREDAVVHPVHTGAHIMQNSNKS